MWDAEYRNKFCQEGDFGLRAAWKVNLLDGWDEYEYGMNIHHDDDEYAEAEDYLSDCLHQACDICIRTLQWQNINMDRKLGFICKVLCAFAIPSMGDCHTKKSEGV